jgi:two-component system nitrogen regulation response regulator GlnG
MHESTILLIDDEPSVRYSIDRALSSDSVRVESTECGRTGIEAARRLAPDIVLLDVRLPDMSGLDVLHSIREVDRRIPVVIITAHGSTQTAIEATKRGAFDYLLKPFDLPQLRVVVCRALEASALARRPAMMDPEEPEEASGDVIIGRSSVMQEVFKAIGRVAASDVNVLLLGESGVGKELVARSIVEHSQRAGAPFLAINCAAIPETLLESELFGHEKGAFTGADRTRVGRFEQASGGSIFLDEIGDMNPALQAKILRVLQDQRFERVGGHETIQTDVRLIAATNQNLVELVAAGRFRQDLFYRLNTYTIAIPPLRSRGDDLQLLANHFIRRHAREVNKGVTSAAPETIEMLYAYLWPGNVRELQGVIKTALVNSTSNVLTPDCLPANISHAPSLPPTGNGHSDHPTALVSLLRKLIDEKDSHVYRQIQFAVDRVVIGEVLQFVNGNQVEAARLLGISRTTLRAKIESFGGTQFVTQRPESEQPVQ